jgi:monoamine oxidase
MPTLYTALLAQHHPDHHRASLPKAEEESESESPLVPEHALLKSALLEDISSSGLLEGPAKKRIGVIGAGFSGLCAAYELESLGYDVHVYEARDRVGGRVDSIRGFAGKDVVEGGAELIGSNHPLWNSYRKHFNLRFSDVKDYRNSPYRFNGKTLTFDVTQDLAAEMNKVFGRLSDLAEIIVDAFEPWVNPDARNLDSESFESWLMNQHCSPLCKEAVRVQLEADNGYPANQQSLLGVLAMVKGGGLDRYWTDTELYRCRGGAERLAKSFQNVLNRSETRVHLSSPVTAITKGAAGVQLWGEEKTPLAEVDNVILSIPPSVWNTLDVSNFPDLAEKLGHPPPMGRNVKALFLFDTRFWQDFASSPTLSSDGPIDLTWETTEADRSPTNVAMVAFSGADDASKCSSWGAQRQGNYEKELEPPYPGIGKNTRNFQFKDWPNEPWTMASYYFPQPGDVLKWGPFWKAGYDDWLHFAGEHTCYAFVGYMEGALASGFRLARRIAVGDKILGA